MGVLSSLKNLQRKTFSSFFNGFFSGFLLAQHRAKLSSSFERHLSATLICQTTFRTPRSRLKTSAAASFCRLFCRRAPSPPAAREESPFIQSLDAGNVEKVSILSVCVCACTLTKMAGNGIFRTARRIKVG